MISATQKSRLMSQATRIVQQAFATTITLLGTEGIAAARWGKSSGADPEMIGLLETCDIVFRVEIALIPGGLAAIEKKKTRIVENGIAYRVETIDAGNGDPAVRLGCKAI